MAIQTNLYGLIIAGILVIYLLQLVARYKKQITEKNMKLAQFQLDKQLVCTLIPLVSDGQNSEPFNKGISLIKNYYDIQDMLIYDISQDEFTYQNSYYNPGLKKYVRNNVLQIISKIEKNNCHQFQINNTEKYSQNYIITYSANCLIVIRDKHNETIGALDFIQKLVVLVDKIARRKE